MANVKITTEKSKDLIKYRSYVYSLEIVKFIATLNNTNVEKIIGNQLLRCGTSVGANIIEAQSGSSRKDFINFYSHALKSANESKFWLCLLRDSHVGDKDRVLKLLDESIQIANMIAKSILTLKGK